MLLSTTPHLSPWRGSHDPSPCARRACTLNNKPKSAQIGSHGPATPLSPAPVGPSILIPVCSSSTIRASAMATSCLASVRTPSTTPSPQSPSHEHCAQQQLLVLGFDNPRKQARPRRPSVSLIESLATWWLHKADLCCRSRQGDASNTRPALPELSKPCFKIPNAILFFLHVAHLLLILCRHLLILVVNPIEPCVGIVDLVQ